ncbi:hypothetical protein ACP4OV_029057 [Aristida adscensionis]
MPPCAWPTWSPASRRSCRPSPPPRRVQQVGQVVHPRHGGLRAAPVRRPGAAGRRELGLVAATKTFALKADQMQLWF